MTFLRKPLLKNLSWFTLSRIAGALLIAAFFYAFQKRVLKAHFGPDEMMNIYGVWHPALWKVVLANFAFWSSFVRPMAAIYYLPLFHWFRLDPVPYSVVRIAILAVNTIVFYKLARAIGGSWWVAVLATFPIAYQADMGNLAFDGAFIYDVLCGGFFFAALLYYIHARRGRQHLSIGQACIFFVLYISALDSKEMAVSLPVVALAYELLLRKHPAGFGSPKERRIWALQLWPTLAAGLMTAIFIVGKTTGQESITVSDAYVPKLNWARFTESTIRFMNTMFYTKGFTMQHAVALWLLVLIAGVAGMLRGWILKGRRNPRWLFLWIWVTVTPLPIVFLPGRGGALLYIIAAGWALAAAMMLRALSALLARHLFLGRVGRFATMASCLLVCLWQYEDVTRRAHRVDVYGYLLIGADTAQWIEEVKRLAIQPKAGSNVLFLHDPAPGTYDITFISSLVWRDRSLNIWQQSQSHLTDERISRMDYIIDYAGGRFAVLKSPTP